MKQSGGVPSLTPMLLSEGARALLVDQLTDLQAHVLCVLLQWLRSHQAAPTSLHSHNTHTSIPARRMLYMAGSAQPAE